MAAALDLKREPQKPETPNGAWGRVGAYSQALEMQRLLMRDAANHDCTYSQRAQIARAWCDLEEEKRKLKMRPLPKPIDVSKPDKRKRHAPILTAPTEAPPQADSVGTTGDS